MAFPLMPPCCVTTPGVVSGKTLRIGDEVIQCSCIPTWKFQRGDFSLMIFIYKRRATRITHAAYFFTLTLLLTVAGPAARAQTPDITSKLNGFDSYMEQVLKDWNTPGIGVGIVANDKLVFAKGYAYPDYDKNLPSPPTTHSQPAPNSNLFT